MTSDPNADRESADRESADAKNVDVAIDALLAGNLDKAESLLLTVIANTPAGYSNSDDAPDCISIKFWSQTTFLHYVTWQKERGLADKRILWIGNAYPRGHYYMGFLCVKRFVPSNFGRFVQPGPVFLSVHKLSWCILYLMLLIWGFRQLTQPAF